MHPEYEKLTIAEKILHLQDLWDQIAASSDDIEITAEQRAELDQRTAAYDADPERGSTWEEARERILKSL